MPHPSPDITRDGSKLLFRRQFILSSNPHHRIAGGESAIVGGRHFVSTHKDLELTQVEKDGKSLTLIGFALDPEHPKATNAEILWGIIDRIHSCVDILNFSNNLGGRWVIVVHDGHETIVHHDATGQRQVCYAKDTGYDSIICASESGILAELLEFSMDQEAIDFIQSRPTDDYEIYWMPGDTTLFSEIKALLPNHYLSLSDGRRHRFLASQKQPSSTDAIGECLHLLSGQLAGARHRFPLSVPMTAGWDSRLILALAREEAPNLHAFTLAYPNLPIDSRDVVIPARLLGKLGIDHHVIPYPKSVGGEFKEIFRRNNVSANTAYCHDIEALHIAYPSDHLCVTGDAAEIVKCYYERDPKNTGPISALELADFSRLGRHPFVLKAFTRWLDGVCDSPVETLDLFCWEQMAGRWQAKVRSEYDMAQESFAPLNHRNLLLLMLSMDSELRKGPDFKLFRALIESLWPAVLSEPINPPERVSLPRRVINLLKKTGILHLIPASTYGRIKTHLYRA